MEAWLLLTLFALTVFFICQVSDRATYLAKFAYLECSYMLLSLLVCLIFLPRPRHPGNGVIGAKLLRYVNRLVPITYTISNVERLEVPSAAVLLLNHQSQIDLMALMEIWPILGNAAPIAKKSLLYMGPFGLACWLVGCVFINRDSRSSRGDMNKFGAEAKKNGTKLMVFPEGTRNGANNLSLLPFKKGAFHVALDGKLPILPVVISQYDFLDHKLMKFSPGKVTIKVLPRIETSEYSKENINDLVRHTEVIMSEALKSMVISDR